MRTNHASALKGLSIAGIVLSALGIIGMLASFGFLGLAIDVLESEYAYNYLDDYDYYDYYDYGYDSFGHHGDDDWDELNLYNDYFADPYYDDYSEWMDVISGLGVAIIAFGLICSIVMLIGSIMVLRNHDKPQRLGLAFGWSLACAILSFVTFGLVSCIIFVIMAVFSYKDKQLYSSGLYSLGSPVQYDPYAAASADPSHGEGYYAPYASAAQDQDGSNQSPYAPVPATGNADAADQAAEAPMMVVESETATSGTEEQLEAMATEPGVLIAVEGEAAVPSAGNAQPAASEAASETIRIAPFAPETDSDRPSPSDTDASEAGQGE